MNTKDSSRKWMWWFLGVVVAMQLYFVRELLAAFALFVLGFGAIAFVLGALYMLHQGWAVAVESLASGRLGGGRHSRKVIDYDTQIRNAIGHPQDSLD